MDQYQQVSPDEQPLSAADYRAIQTALATLNRAARKMDRARNAGVACDEQDAQCQYLRDRLEKLKAVYYPDKP